MGNPMNDFETQAHFAMEKGKRDSDRLVQDCLDGLARLLHEQLVGVDDKLYRMKVIGKNGGKIMLDINGLPGFDHIEFTVEKTGWGRDLTEPTDGKADAK
jgi:hypothetical protein